MKLVNLLALMVGVGLSACAAHTAAGPAPTANADDQATAELKEHHRHHHRGGVAQFIAMSLDTLGTDDAKRAQIEKLQGELHTCMAPASEAEKKLLSTLADGIAAGSLAPATVDPMLAQLETSVTAVHECAMDSINKLHALLSPPERAELAEKVRAHWEVWKKVNHEEEVGGQEKGGRLAELKLELGLTADQVEKIAAALKTAHPHAVALDPQKGEAHIEAFAQAFAGESFDAKAVTQNANSHLATHGGKRMAHFYETVTPLLTPEQRTKLAEHLREHASHQPVSPAK